MQVINGDGGCHEYHPGSGTMRIENVDVCEGISTGLELAIRACVLAGRELRKRENIHADAMKGKDIKLSSDRQSEKIIMELLSESGLPILSEEYGSTDDFDLSKECWIIDPLDGTMNYFRGMDELACVSVALWKGGRPYLGCVYRFQVGELFYGEAEFGAFVNNTRISPSQVVSTSQAIVATGFPVKRSYDTESLSDFVSIIQNFKKVRMLGAAAIMGTFVSCGRIDAYMEDEIMLWDIAAAAAIVEAAGGFSRIELLDDYKCLCKLFATAALMEDYDAKSL